VRLGRRLDRLERPAPGGRLPLWALRLAERLAAEHGLDPKMVVAEAEAVLARAETAGVLGSEEGWAAFLATEGLDPEPFLAEARRLVGQA
jgi:hypothetical protein